MNRQQRRQAKHKNPHLASRALFEDELRRALRKRDVQLIACSTGEQGDEPRWVLEVRRGDTRLFMQSPPKTVDGMVKQILAKLDGEPEVPIEPVTPAPTPAERFQEIVARTAPLEPAKLTGGTTESFEELSRYLGEK